MKNCKIYHLHGFTLNANWQTMYVLYFGISLTSIELLLLILMSVKTTACTACFKNCISDVAVSG